MLKPLLRFDDPVVTFPLLIPMVPVPVLVPTPLAAVSPLVPPPPAPCPKAMDELIARTEAKAIVVSNHVLFLAPRDGEIEATAPTTG